MKKFKLHFLRDNDDSNPKHYFDEHEPEIGQVIQVENGFYHVVVTKRNLKKIVRLDLSESGQSETEARNLMTPEQRRLIAGTPH